MRVFVTGGTGVLGRILIPLLDSAGHQVAAPRHAELDLFDASAVNAAVAGAEAVYHLATRIRQGAWDENDRIRRDATRLLVDAAIAAGSQVFVQPSVTFMYPTDAQADEETPLNPASNLGSLVAAETEVRRFAASGKHGIVLRLGLLWGPGTGNDAPSQRFNSTLQVEDAAEALFLALALASGVYNVTADGERISNARFKAASGWRPRH